MSVTIVDNNDYMFEIWTENPEILKSLLAQNLFTKHHILEDNLWLVRCEFVNFNPIHTQLAQAKYKMLEVRFTTGSRYFSSDKQDELLGNNITG